MKKYLILTVIVLVLCSMFTVPAVFAEYKQNNIADINIESAELFGNRIDLSGNTNIKTIDLFIGEEAEITTSIRLNRDYGIDVSEVSVNAVYSHNDKLNVTQSAKNNFDSNNYYIVKETVKVSSDVAGTYQLIVSFNVGNKEYFDGIQINVLEKDIKSITLVPDVTTVRTNSTVNFRVMINSSPTLGITGDFQYYINGNKLDSLDNYVVPDSTSPLEVKIVFNGTEYNSTIPVVRATALTDAKLSSNSYSFLFKDKTGELTLYTNTGSYPNISLITNNASATLTDIKQVSSDISGMDKYTLTISFNNGTTNENLIVKVDDMMCFAKLNIISMINSLSIVSDDSTFYANKPSKFHIVINGIKDVDTEVVWKVNDIEQSTKSNILEYNAIAAGDFKVNATVGDVSTEFNYTIDISKGQIILTIIISVAVIVLCIPIMILLRKAPKANLKEIILKDNTSIINDLEKLKKAVTEDNTKQIMNLILRINAKLLKTERRAQQEAYESINKAFLNAHAAIIDAKTLADKLLPACKSKDNDNTISIIDGIINNLKIANNIISKVIANS